MFDGGGIRFKRVGKRALIHRTQRRESGELTMFSVVMCRRCTRAVDGVVEEEWSSLYNVKSS